MNTHNNNLDDEQFRAIFAPLTRQVPPHDAVFRQQLRAKSQAAFTRTSAGRQSNKSPNRRPRMIRLGWRSGAAAAVAAGLIAAILLLTLNSPAAAEPTLGDVLGKLGQVSTVRLAITRGDGPRGEAWFSQPGLLRENNPDGTYLVARGGRAWLVDDKANRAKPQPGRFFSGDDQRLDVLALLELGDADGLAAALSQGPAERVKRDGVKCLVYRAYITTPAGRVKLDASADAATGLLRSLEAQVDRDGKLHPVATLTVLAVGEPVQEDLFVIGDKLTQDGRIGKITDAQGIVSVKPVMASRWTPVSTGMLARPGDWVQTDVRGANAATVRLLAPAEVVVGPGSLVELVAAGQVRVHYGEVRIAPDGKKPVELQGPGEQKLQVAERSVYRVQDDKLVRLDKEPLWLKSYEGQVANESIGSLVAKVDGRNLPLTVGYHKVTVDIRDQIARTVVEESFVNRTNGRLEGVFYFPLPQDASISGFGMWIGNELVEADVVEKQRAREIYEQILRERRDPGLLEWSGGNLFKARVFPIEPHSEKRIKITYTQVLPMKGGSYRYSYALQSEMLKQHPLRELQVDVKVHSAMPLVAVACPTHPARVAQTANSAHVEFAAQEYTPTQDFEVAVVVDAPKSGVVLIPHRRGDDGYFMLMVTPPAGDESDRPDILPDAAPQELLILADTSGSLTNQQRAIQAEFIAALLMALGPKDTFNLAACDVDCDWVFPNSVAAAGDSVATARDYLEGRVSLGWSDLDKAFASAIERAGPNTRVIYVGDGIHTTTDADPVAFAKRLKRLYEGKQGAFYAVSVGSTYESGVLKAIASLGGGSVRHVDEARKVRSAVREMLDEMARPPLRDLKVEFTGLRTARVYPEQLTNLPAASQQILMGRYLPAGADHVGEVVVTGVQGGKAVRFAAPVSLKDAEQGNSFIPRLWARMYLDALLQQGTSRAIQDEIIALSEEYHIITPYTSLLVLESDADRERFKVMRRFQMRDGEKFFAEGRGSANYELTQQQMKLAGTWRIGLRRSVLQQLGMLGRDESLFQPPSSYPLSYSRGVYKLKDMLERTVVGGADYWYDIEAITPSEEFAGSDFKRVSKFSDDRIKFLSDGLEIKRVTDPAWADADEKPGAKAKKQEMLMPVWAREGRYSKRRARMNIAKVLSERTFEYGRSFFGSRDWDERSYDYQYTHWLNSLFPTVPAPTKAPQAVKSGWPEEARRISRALLRTELLAKLPAIAVDRRAKSFDAKTGRLSTRNDFFALLSPKAWLIRTESHNQQTSVQHCDGNRRAIFQKGFLLGRTRPAVADDLQNPPATFGIYALTSPERSYASYRATVEALPDQQVRLVLTHANMPDRQTRILVDKARWVVLSLEHVSAGKVTGTQKYSRFVEFAGAWWPTLFESFDSEARRVGVTTETLTAPAGKEFDRLLRAELADEPRVQFLQDPGRLVPQAKRAAAAGKADFDDQVALIMDIIRSQQWDRAFTHLEAAEKLAGNKPGMALVRNALLQISRRHEPLKTRLLERVAALAKSQPNRDNLPLAEHLVGQAQGFMEANEMLALLDVVKPVYERQAAHREAMKGWRKQRINQLQRVGHNDEAVALMKLLSEQYPRDVSIQLQYSRGLANMGRPAEALAVLRAALARPGWRPYNEEQLRNRYADLLTQQGRWEDLLAFTTEWMGRDLPSTGAYLRHLGALIRLDRVDQSDALIVRWLKEGQSDQPLPVAAAGRLQAAVLQALGQGHGIHMQWIEPRWLQPLAGVALRLAAHPSLAHVADRIMNDWRFRQTDAARSVRSGALEMLQAGVDKLSPRVLQRLVRWMMSGEPAVEKSTWKELAAALYKRWQATESTREKHALGATLVQVYSGRLDVEEHLAFLREQLQAGPAEYRTAYARQLFDALTAQPFRPQYEDEAFALLDKLSEDKDPARRLFAMVGALHTLDGRMVQARYTAKMKAVPRQEELTRTELMAKQAENMRLAREELADRLGREAAKREGPIVRWLQVEQMYFDVLAGRKLDAAASQAWELLGPAPRQPAADDAEGVEAVLDDALRNRMLVTLANLACRRSADAELARQLLAYIDQAITAQGEDLGWKLMKYEMLIALDRPAELQEALEAWARTSDGDYRWTLSLGYLLAEQGKLAEAIRLFEQLAEADELGPREHRTLANWYMAVDRRSQYERAMIETYKVMPEWRLQQMLQQRLDPWQRRDGKPPAELDEQTLLVFAALFEKAGSPGQHLYMLRNYYTATRDFRLLSGLADATVGHTAGKVYPFLRNLRTVLSEVRDEATADSIVEHLAKVRQRAKTDVDRRSLDLLEMLAERRSAELLNQPGPHGEKALAALKRAFQPAWSSGEPRLMAELLASLGAITYKPLAGEQVRQLEALHAMARAGSEDRLYIAHALANTYWNYSRYNEGIDLLAAGLDEFQKASGGVLPASANGPLGQLVSFLERRSHFARGETVLAEQLKHPAGAQQTLWLKLRLFQLYGQALANDGDVSLGRGATLYKAVEQQLIEDMATDDQNHRYNLVSRLCSLYRTAANKKIATVADDLRTFASRTIPKVLKRQTNQYTSIVGAVAQALKDLASPLDALAFLVERIEQEPAWFRWNNQDGWSSHSYLLGELRPTLDNSPDAALEARLLKIVLDELRRDLRTNSSRSRNMYYQNHSYYWQAKREDFIRVAEEIYTERKQSGSAVVYIAQYLFSGLGHRARAIEILKIAHGEQRLDESGQWQLVQFLHHEKRYVESVSILQALIESRPDNMTYRVSLMRAYFKTGQRHLLLGLLAQTDEHFHKEGRWGEAPLAALAHSTLDNELYEQSVKYYDELIPLHQRTRANRGIGNGVLSGYYGWLAQAHARQGQMAEAVEAACGAVIAWGPTHHNRAGALRSVQNVIRQAKDLNALVAQLDRQAQETGLHNPIVRKAVGQVYLEKRQFDRAIAQLTLAIELQPNDMETQRAIISAYDQQGDKSGAIAAILQAVQLARRDFSLFADLGRRYAAMEQTALAERAYTSIVEVLPNESESHAALAEIRQKQERWSDAAVHWAQVAAIRSLEPTGLLKLAEVQLRLKQWDAAAESIRKLRARSWPSRFGNVDAQARDLERRLEQARTKAGADV
jgi:predicted Zn-dependent protease